MSADELQKSPASSWGAVNDKLREALTLLVERSAAAMIRFQHESPTEHERQATQGWVEALNSATAALAADDAARGTMREAFEAWAREYGRIFLNRLPQPMGLACGEIYENQFTQEAWVGFQAGWQAATRAAALPCGHPTSLMLHSAETGEPLYCELCDDKSGRADAERRESELLAANESLRGELAAQQAAPTEADRLDAWIACSERMPAAGLVLVTAEFDGPGDWRIKVGDYHEGTWNVFGASWTPTHWMPLPKPPDIDAAMAAQAGGKGRGS